ncbi:Battenin [Aphelenchoides fujianensis]|nr:Battenin [Aphelenchoides fujianensis]
MASQPKMDVTATKKVERDWRAVRNFIAFWIFGMANNFSYVVMLSAAEDIMGRQQSGGLVQAANNVTETCEVHIEGKSCGHAPLGIILLADVVPLFLFKGTFPFLMHKVSYGTQVVFIAFTHISSYLIVAFSSSVWVSMVGVAFGAVGSGLGENTFLALSGHYSKHTISTWSSGTGGAGLFAALFYAALTEPHLANLTPETSLLIMLVVPCIFLFTYFFVLTPAESIYRITVLNPSTWIVPKNKGGAQDKVGCVEPEKPKPIWTVEAGLESGGSSDTDSASTDSSSACSTVNPKDEQQLYGKGAPTFADKRKIMWPLLLKYVLPLSIVYYAQYLVNQGLAGFMIFDCAHGFGLSKTSQYRWYQVLFQLGVFISRSSVNLIRLPLAVLLILPVLQAASAAFFFVDVFQPFVPHIAISFALILVQGFVGGFSYVNSFFRIHKEVPSHLKEFSMSFTSIAAPIGITLAGLSSVPIHKAACGWSS